jgi:stearoyl-CoA desaturase (delta-9 desaturase)
MIEQKAATLPLAKRLVAERIAAVAAVHALAGVALFFPSWHGLAAFAAMHLATGCLGVSVGLHRLLAHRAFQAPPLLRNLLATLGTLAYQGGPLRWVAIHRAHHRHADGPGDPHARTQGFLFSHIGWAFVKAPNGYRYRHLARQVPDLARIPWLVALERHHTAVNLTAFACAIALCGWQVALWAFPLRIVATWHATWLVNSVGHAPASAEAKAGATARNLPWLALLTYGEGFHANHHAAPRAPRLGVGSIFWDQGYLVIAALCALGLAAEQEAEA